MSGIRIHALEGSMLSSKPGISKLMMIARKGSEDTQVFVLSPVDSPELSMVSLLSAVSQPLFGWLSGLLDMRLAMVALLATSTALLGAINLAFSRTDLLQKEARS